MPSLNPAAPVFTPMESAALLPGAVNDTSNSGAKGLPSPVTLAKLHQLADKHIAAYNKHMPELTKLKRRITALNKTLDEIRASSDSTPASAYVMGSSSNQPVQIRGRKDVEKYQNGLKEKIRWINNKLSVIHNDMSTLEQEIAKAERMEKRNADALSRRNSGLSTLEGKLRNLARENQKLMMKKAALNADEQRISEEVAASQSTRKLVEKDKENQEIELREVTRGRAQELYRNILETNVLLADLAKAKSSEGIKSIELVQLERLAQLTRVTPMTLEQLDSVTSDLNYQRYTRLFTAFGILLAYMAANARDVYTLASKSQQITQELQRLSEPNVILTSEHAATKLSLENQREDIGRQFQDQLMTMMFVSVGCAALSYVMQIWQTNRTMVSTLNASNQQPMQRVLTLDTEDALRSRKRDQGEELTKFIFFLSQNLGSKIARSPLEYVSEEISRVLFTHFLNPDKSIEELIASPEAIKNFLFEFKTKLEDAAVSLDVRLTKVMEKLKLPSLPSDTRMNIEEIKNNPELFRSFAAKIPRKEAPEVIDIYNKRSLILRFSEFFSGNNDGLIVKGITDILIDIAKTAKKSLLQPSGDEEGSSTKVTDLLDKLESKASTLHDISQLIADRQREHQTVQAEIETVDKWVGTIIKNAHAEMDAKKQYLTGATSSIELRILELAHKLTGKSDWSTSSTDPAMRSKKTPRVSQGLRTLPELLSNYDDLFANYNKLHESKEFHEGLLADAELKLDTLTAEEEVAKDEAKKINEELQKEQAANEETRRNTKLTKLEAKLSKCVTEKASIEEDIQNDEEKFGKELEGVSEFNSIISEFAYQRLQHKHLNQTETALNDHARENGYASVYLSRAHMIKAVADVFKNLKKDLDAGNIDPNADRIEGFLTKSDITVAKGRNRMGQTAPLNRTQTNIDRKKVPGSGEYRYVLAHAQGFVPRRIPVGMQLSPDAP